MTSPLSILRTAVIVAIFAAPPAFACPEVSGCQATSAAATPTNLVAPNETTTVTRFNSPPTEPEIRSEEDIRTFYAKILGVAPNFLRGTDGTEGEE